MYKKFPYLLILLLFSCNLSPSPSITTFHGIAMTMEFNVKIGESLTENQKKEIKKIIFDTFNEVDQVYNIWNPDSELSKLNKAKSNEWIQISEKLENLLIITDEMVKKTNGLFDPTIAPLQDLWKNSIAIGQIPTKNEIEALRPAIGWKNIIIKNGKILKNKSTRLDLGGIAKGYCVDLIAERLKTQHNNFYVEWGGEIRVGGEHPDHRPWTVFISNLGDSNPENALGVISLSNQAVATSGDYLQQWTYKSKEKEIAYSHIINPQTLEPIIANNSNICSATVIAGSCVEADALATALMLFSSIEKATEWIESLRIQQPEINYYLMNRKNN